jgi:hypothetical protein
LGTYRHQLLSSALEILDSDVGGDGGSVPTARSAATARTGSKAKAINVLFENHLSRIDHMTEQMVAIVELKSVENLQAKIKEVSSQMKYNKESLQTISDKIFDMQLKLLVEFQVEVEDCYSTCPGDGSAVKLYKVKLHQMKQQQTGIDDDQLNLEQEKKEMVKQLAEMERLSKKEWR